MSPTASSRWCPTPEQLMILEEMYRSGIRTPNANLIKQITAHLSHYGKIEGKNVFYWFQNHKARDRQKLRRKLSKIQQEQMFHYHHQQEWNLQNQHFLYNFGSPASALQQVPYYHDPPSYLHQVGAVGAVSHGNIYAWNSLEIPQQVGIHDPFMRIYNNEHENHLGFSPPPPYCCPRPLKTLELFPIKSTNLKEESNHISCSASMPSTS